MLGSMADRIILSPPERRELQRMSRSRSVRAEDARRARIILSLASGFLSLWAISREERCSINTVRMWRDRFKEQRLPGLWSRHRGRAPSEGIAKLEARIIDWSLHRKPADGSTHWRSMPSADTSLRLTLTEEFDKPFAFICYTALVSVVTPVYTFRQKVLSIALRAF